MNATKDPLTGRFIPSQATYGVTEILLPNGRVGFRVGEHGRIYANREHAVNHALCRRPKTVGTRSRVKFDSSRPAKATRTRLETFGEGIEPQATQPQAEPSEGQPEAPVSGVAKSRDLEDRRRRIQQRIADREARVREAHRHAFGGEGTTEERQAAWPLFRKWDRRRERAARAYNKIVARRRRETPGYDAKTGGVYTGD
jgi:hypothetical protein